MSFLPASWRNHSLALFSLLAVLLSPHTLAIRLGLKHSLYPRAAVPLPPVWPGTFFAEFDEENFFGLVTLTNNGSYFYDYTHNRERVDRSNGVADRYCGSALPFRQVPCSHIVTNGTRYLVFPDSQYCCKCCDDAGGCGVLNKNWLKKAKFEGNETVDGLQCYKWSKPGLQQNYYWETPDGTPVRIYQVPNNQITYRHDTVDSSVEFPNSVFALPSGLNCTQGCDGLCAVLGSRRRHSPKAGLAQLASGRLGTSIKRAS